MLPFFPAFLAGMNLVLLADDAYSFLFSWELMSLASWALVMAHHRDPENRRAGFIYLVMASFGTLALLLAFGLLAGPAGGYGFEAIRAAQHSPVTSALVLALLLVGAGSKAGLVPLHIWLPLAHPAAPSHVSALMSGVMTKVAVYAFIRVVFDLVGGMPWWSAMVVLAIGGASAVLGVLQALLQDDLKRLLAYSTIENIGIIFVGLGLALAFQANAMPMAAALAMTAALFHVLNHSFFKSLLFFGAGAVLTATGERNMDRLGGLIHRMPVTAFLFLAGCVAISALPPLNGFVSEWLTFQAILQSPDLPQWGLKVIVPAVGGLLAVAAAFAAATFVKAFGIAFLGRPRSRVAETADRGRPLLARRHGRARAFCASPPACCPASSSTRWRRSCRRWSAPRCRRRAACPGCGWCRSRRAAAPMTGCWCSCSSRRRRCRRPGRCIASPRENCAGRRPGIAAFPMPAPSPNIPARASRSRSAASLRRASSASREKLSMPAPGDTRPARFSLVIGDPVWDVLYAPVAGAVGFAATKLNRLQFLTIRRYLTLVFLALVGLLLVLAIWS